MARKHKRRLAARSHGIYATVYNFKKGKAEAIHLKEMSHGEIFMIGMATVHWAYLEHMLLLETAKLVNRAKLPEMPAAAVSLSFSDRLKTWRKLVQTTVKTKSARDRLLKLASKIANAETTRHQITHGLWEWYPSNPIRLRAYSFRPRVEFDERNLSFEKIRDFALKIAQYGCEITQPLTANKPAQLSKQMKSQSLENLKSHKGAYMHRLLMLELIGKDHAELVPKRNGP
jgi:hypothetical protein